MFHIKPSTWVKNRLDTLVDVSKMSDEDQSEWKNWMMLMTIFVIHCVLQE